MLEVDGALCGLSEDGLWLDCFLEGVRTMAGEAVEAVDIVVRDERAMERWNVDGRTAMAVIQEPGRSSLLWIKVCSLKHRAHEAVVSASLLCTRSARRLSGSEPSVLLTVKQAIEVFQVLKDICRESQGKDRPVFGRAVVNGARAVLPPVPEG